MSNKETSNLNFSLSEYKFIDLFAGIGGLRMPFDELKATCVFSSEWDKYAAQTYAANYGDVPHGDITKIDEKDIPEFDILLAGFPCQPFSNAGHKKGFDDTRGTLFFDICRIVNHHKPKVLFLENVKSFKTHNKGETFKVMHKALYNLGYTVHTCVLNAKHFGVPQNRERLYIVAFKNDVDFTFPIPTTKETKVGDILSSYPVDDKYTISDKAWTGHKLRKLKNQAKGSGFGYSLVNDTSEYTSTMLARYCKDGSEILIDQGSNKNPRKLTPREASKLQGFPDCFNIPVSDSQAYKQFGNSVAVPVIRKITKSICKAITGGTK